MSGEINEIEAFWSAYREANARACDLADQPPESWGFGDSPEMADELGQLVVRGIKTATCSLLWEYESEGEALPREGDLSIIVNGAGQPLCIIETIQVRTIPFDKVDAQFAYDEGERDRSLAYWRRAHWRYFSRVCQQLDRSVSTDMPLVCERFQLLYKPD
jgi:uncharacterized protein YhfF